MRPRMRLRPASRSWCFGLLGAAVLAFTRLFKEPLKGVTRRYYHIDGSWDNPIVERIDKQEAKQEQKQEAKSEAAERAQATEAQRAEVEKK